MRCCLDAPCKLLEVVRLLRAKAPVGWRPYLAVVSDDRWRRGDMQVHDYSPEPGHRIEGARALARPVSEVPSLMMVVFPAAA